MTGGRAILALRYTPVSVAGGVRRAVGGFLRYVQHRDQHIDAPAEGGLDAYTRYVAHRDRTSPGGRIFGRDGDRPELDRKCLVDYIGRSIRGLEPRWVSARDGKLVDRQRAVYTFVLSPEDWRGLDLRPLARAAMARLEEDSGGLGPWFAAEHRNTAHHHVHIVLAARREVAPGRFRTVLITRPRLERMKAAMRLEMARQRELEQVPAPTVRTRVVNRPSLVFAPASRHSSRAWRPLPKPRSQVVPLQPKHARRLQFGFGLQALGRYYRHQMERELERELQSREHRGWLR